MEPVDKTELLWRQYELTAKMFKFYIATTLKINIFYYAITGAILSYYFTHTNQPHVKLALALPFCMSFLLAVLFVIGGVLGINGHNDIRDIGGKLGFKFVPAVGVLSLLLWISAALMILVAIGMGYLIFYQ